MKVCDDKLKFEYRLTNIYFQLSDKDDCRIPSLICRNCVRDLKTCMKFRKRCRETNEFFRKAANDVESWKNDCEEASGSKSQESSQVKQEAHLDSQEIKDEPEDFDLFRNVDTVLEENPTVSEESALVRLLRNAKKEKSSSDISSSDSEYDEESLETRKLNSKRSSEYRDFDLK